MRAFVYTDKRLSSYAGQFVWLSINTEKSSNAGFLQKFPVSAWPSMFIVNPKSETISYRWTGGATLAQLETWLAAARGTKAAGLSPALRAELKKADEWNGKADYKEAAAAYASVLKKAPGNFSEYPRVMDAYLFALQMTQQYEPCATSAREAFAREAHLPNAANVASSGLDCALSMPKENPGRAQLIAELEQDCRAVLANKRTRFAADDISSTYIELIGAREEAGDKTAKSNLETEWVAFLEHAAATAKTPEQRTVFDSHRLSAYLEIKQPERAIPMLEQSERDFPSDYNPPARLAIAYDAMKDYGKALAAADKALALAYGPRKIGIYRTRAKIYKNAGNLKMAVKTLEEALTYANALPMDQQYGVASLQKELDKLKEQQAAPAASSAGA